MVIGISPRVRKCDENPPPRIYSRPAGYHVVAWRHASASLSDISQNGFIAGLPAASDCCPVASSVQEPELMRWMMPPAARPVSRRPVTRSTASGDQNVRTSAKSCARLVSRCSRSIEAPLSVSFSVAKVTASRMPFQSNDELRIASGKSPSGRKSVHWRCPWNPPAMALCPMASSSKPISASFGLPCIRSRKMSVIFTTYSQTASFCSRE